MFHSPPLRSARRGSQLLQSPRGTISEIRSEGQYCGHWRIADDVLLVKLGIYVEAVPAGGTATDSDAIAHQVFAGMIDRYVAKKTGRVSLYGQVDFIATPQTRR
jgi:hypothetical protein